jgi:hypothetical protein
MIGDFLDTATYHASRALLFRHDGRGLKVRSISAMLPWVTLGVLAAAALSYVGQDVRWAARIVGFVACFMFATAVVGVESGIGYCFIASGADLVEALLVGLGIREQGIAYAIDVWELAAFVVLWQRIANAKRVGGSSG